MNKKIYFGIAIVFIILGAVLVFGINKDNSSDSSKGDVEKISIGMNNYNYYPNTIKVKAGVPVEITLDDSVGGCFRDLVIPKLGIRKYLQGSKDKVTVTFDKGEYVYACSMYMGQGKIIAE